MPKNTTQKIQDKISFLKTAREQYIKLSLEMLQADDNKLHTTDLYMQGIVQRAIDSLESLIILFDNKKYLTVMVLLRMHFETLLNIYALFIVKNPGEVSMNIMRGKKRINDYKDGDGNKMTYSYLTKKFCIDSKNGEFNFDSNIYNKLSGFIHFGHRHIFYGMSDTKEQMNEKREFTLEVGGSNITNEEKNEILDLATVITKAQFKYIIGWIKTKEGFKKVK